MELFRPVRPSGKSVTSRSKFLCGTPKPASSAASAPWSARTAVIRIKVYDSRELTGAPATFKSTDARDKEWQGLKYTIQVAPEDCTGCGICVDVCPAKNKSETRLKAINMEPQPPLRAAGERELGVLPEASRTRPQEHQADHDPAAAGAGAIV